MTNYCSTCQNYIEDDPCAVCEGTENNHVYYEPDFRKQKKSNADRFRAKSDEELAEFLAEVADSGFGSCAPGCYDCENHSDCKEAWLEWLKKEVDDGD